MAQKRVFSDHVHDGYEGAQIDASNLVLPGDSTQVLKGDGTWGSVELYKVGDLYLTTTATDPATSLGYGTWALWGAGRVPLCVDTGDTDFNTVEKTGGAKSCSDVVYHRHDINDPGHQHTEYVVYGGAGANNGPVYVGDQAYATPSGSKTTFELANITDTGYTGVSSISLLNPYITCYIWKRTA